MNNIDEANEEEKENGSEEEGEEAQNKVNIYNLALDKVLTFFFNNEILVRVQFCPKCGKQMTLETNQNKCRKILEMKK